MVAQKHGNMVRVSLTLDPVDVDLLDRIAVLEKSNRSSELRGILAQFRPMFRATVEAMEAAMRQRDGLNEAMAEAAKKGVDEITQMIPELERMQNAYLGTMARLEGMATVADTDSDPRPSNHGGHTPTPPPGSSTPELGSEQGNSGDEA